MFDYQFDDNIGGRMGKEINECNVVKDGVCALHGVEVERRRAVRDNIEEIQKKMPFLLSSINKLLAFQVILIVIMGGSYTYTRDVSQSADIHARDARAEILSLSESVNSLKAISARTDERYLSVLRELEVLNRHMTALLNSTPTTTTSYQKEQKR